MSLVYNRLRNGKLLYMRLYGPYGGPVFIPVPLVEGVAPEVALSRLRERGDVSMIDFEGEVSDSFKLNDDDFNSISWAPAGDGDNTCHHSKVTGEIRYTEGIQKSNLRLSDWYENWNGYHDYYAWKANTQFYGRFTLSWSETRWYSVEHLDYASINGLSGYNAWGPEPNSRVYYTTERISGFTYRGTWWYPGGDKYHLTYFLDFNQDFQVIEIKPTSGYSTKFLRDAYSSLRGHAVALMQKADFDPSMEFTACQNAALSYQAYDINMVENLFGLSGGLSEQLPASVADSLTTAIARSSHQNLPSKILDVAKTLGSTYLYSKYVFETGASDIQALTGVRPVEAVLDEDDTNEYTNLALQVLAEQMVYKGNHIVSRYGTASDTVHDGALGDIHCHCNARIRAYPRFLKDMSDAAIIVDNIGLSLSAERLAEVIPYEFVANWFLPIEDSIRAIEYNDSRLNSMWQVQGICTSRTVTAGLGNLLALHGLSRFSGELVFTLYDRAWGTKFPSTRLPAVAPAFVNPSRVLQGAALIITN